MSVHRWRSVGSQRFAAIVVFSCSYHQTAEVKDSNYVLSLPAAQSLLTLTTGPVQAGDPLNGGWPITRPGLQLSAQRTVAGHATSITHQHAPCTCWQWHTRKSRIECEREQVRSRQQTKFYCNLWSIASVRSVLGSVQPRAPLY